ncbi:hypothetical protein TIFTF001_004617 [Ficus carica]|uniref:Serine carboxypeptidase n=1 Tax=Ficus carica TaxID=3494 RepID=A0AA88CY80_FICCA|nr:hypothetical protein TIFTF001_004617 [Ficus carica]
MNQGHWRPESDYFLVVLPTWLLAHPEFSSNPLYLGGDSYGGFIVPIVAEEIAKSIEASHTPEFNFHGYLVGNSITSPYYDDNFKVQFAHHMALISDELYESVKRTCEGQYQGNHDNYTPCANDLNAISLCTENLNEQQILEPKCKSIFSANGKMEEINRKLLLEKPSDPKWLQPSLSFGGPPPDYPEFGCRRYENLLAYFWANDKGVQRALHIKEGSIKTWIRCPKNLPYETQVESVVSYHQRLNSRGYRALVYSGDHDMTIPYIGTQAWIKSLNIPIVGQWRPWLVDDQIAGYVTEYSNGISFVTVKARTTFPRH